MDAPVPIERYHTWVRENILTELAIVEINVEAAKSIRDRNQEASTMDINKWIEHVWVKWCQLYLKHIRYKRHDLPKRYLVTTNSEPPANFSPEPNVMADGIKSVVDHPRPTLLARKIIQNLFEENQIPSAEGLIKYVLKEYGNVPREHVLESPNSEV
jgi:hypothetical protein